MNRDQAATLLSDIEVVPVLEAPVAEAKQIVDACLAAGVPVVLGRDDHCTKGCSPKLLLLAREEDGPLIAQVLRARWGALVEQEGIARVKAAEVGEGALPCPACGTGVPDDASECPDCGLVV